MRRLLFIASVGAALISTPARAHAQSRLEAGIFTVGFSFSPFMSPQPGDQKAVVRADDVDVLVDEIFKAIKPAEPLRPSIEIPLGDVMLDKFRETLSDKKVVFDFVELRVKAPGEATPGTVGKTGPGSNIERRAVKADQLESGKRYEVNVSKTGYMRQTSEFAVQRQSGKLHLMFGDDRLTLRPAGGDKIRFVVDTTALAADSRKSVRQEIGTKLNLKHHMFDFLDVESLQEILPSVSAVTNASVEQQRLPRADATLKYVIVVVRR